MSEINTTEVQKTTAPAGQRETPCSAECPICRGDYATADLAFRLGHRPDIAFAKLAKCQKDKFSGLDEMVYAAVYADDGPNGICGQSCSVTTPWRRLYLFRSEHGLREFCDKVQAVRARKNSRIEYVFYPQPIANEIFIGD